MRAARVSPRPKAATASRVARDDERVSPAVTPCRLTFSTAMIAGSGASPSVARATRLKDNSELVVALAEFATRRRKSHGVRSADDVADHAMRELERLEFALPGTSIKSRGKLLLANHWDHKQAILSTLKSKIGERCHATLSESLAAKYDKFIVRAFVGCKAETNPVDACVRLLQAHAVHLDEEETERNEAAE